MYRYKIDWRWISKIDDISSLHPPMTLLGPVIPPLDSTAPLPAQCQVHPRSPHHRQGDRGWGHCWDTVNTQTRHDHYLSSYQASSGLASEFDLREWGCGAWAVPTHALDTALLASVHRCYWCHHTGCHHKPVNMPTQTQSGPTKN